MYTASLILKEKNISQNKYFQCLRGNFEVLITQFNPKTEEDGSINRSAFDRLDRRWVLGSGKRFVFAFFHLKDDI